jgi:outer membrane receptor protein involved in Fe transport
MPAGSRLSVTFTASTVRATVDVPQPGGGVQEEFISRANRLFGKTGVKYASPGKRWWGLAQVRWSDAYEDVSPRDATDARMTIAGDAAGRMPGFGVVDLKVGWRSKDNSRTLTFAVENLLDKTYRDPGSGTDGPGMNFVVSAQTRF